jgi:hypothetical protein
MNKTKFGSIYFPIIFYSVVSIYYVYYQSSQVISLWDFTNYTDLAVRILHGQIPYVEIPLYTQPGTFIELAASMFIFGKNIYAVYFVILLKQFLIGFILSTLFSQLFKNTIFDKLIIKLIWLLLFALMSPWSVVPQNTYDADLAIALLVAIFLLIKYENYNSPNTTLKHTVNIVIVLIITYYPFFFKQTSGLVWLVMMHLYFIFTFVRSRRPNFLYLIVIDSFLVLIFSFLEFNYKLVSNWWLWAIQKPLENRYTPNMTPFAQLERLMEYENTYLTIIFVSIIFLVVLRKFSFRKSYFVFIVTGLSIIVFNFLRVSSLKSGIFIIDWNLLLVPSIFLVLATSLLLNIFSDQSIKIKVIIASTVFTLMANFLSQGVLGSSYGFFQLYLLLILLSLIPLINSISKQNWTLVKLFAILYVPILFSSTVVYYSNSKIRMSYVRFDESVEKYPTLYSWIGTPGSYLKETQTGIDLFEKYIKKGRTAVWPGEDPVSLFSSAIPSTQVSISDSTTNPYYNDVDKWLKDQNIEYIILKSRLHTPGQHQISIDKLEQAAKNFVRIEKQGVYFVLERKLSN